MDFKARCAADVLHGADGGNEAVALHLIHLLMKDGLSPQATVIVNGDLEVDLVGLAAARGLFSVTCKLLDAGAPADAMGPRWLNEAAGGMRQNRLTAERRLPLASLLLDNLVLNPDMVPDTAELPRALARRIAGPGMEDFLRAVVETYGIDINSADGALPVAHPALREVFWTVWVDDEDAESTFRMLREIGVDPNQRDAFGGTLMHHLFSELSRFGCADDRKRFIACVDHLVNFGVDINAADKQGRTLLHLAAERVTTGSSAYVKGVIDELIKRGSSASVRDARGRAAAFAAFDGISRDLDRKLTRNDTIPDTKPLVEMVESMRRGGFDLADCDNDGLSLADAIRGASEWLGHRAVRGKHVLGHLEMPLLRLSAQVEKESLVSRRKRAANKERRFDGDMAL